MTITFDKVSIGQHQYPSFSINAKQGAPIIHFTGANGFPAGMYEHFLKQFGEQFNITAADCRAVSRERHAPPKGFGLSGFADELITVIETLHDKPVIGMGHSFGGHISVIAAIKRPDLFDKLVLIEPASLPNPSLDLYYRKLPKALLYKLLPMIKRTKERQRVWPSKQLFIEKYRHHPTFKHFTDQAMQAYAEHGLYQRSDGQYELVFDPEWEAYIFSNMEFLWKNLRKSEAPCLFLRAEHSNLYSSQRFKKENTRLGSHFSGIEIEATHHLMPLEKPEICYRAIDQWLSNVK